MIKIKKGLLSFNGHLPNFLYGPVKALKWEKFFMGEIKVRLDTVNIFYAAKYHPNKSYTIVERKKMFFTVEEIYELHDLPNDQDKYLGQRLIANLEKEMRKG